MNTQTQAERKKERIKSRKIGAFTRYYKRWLQASILVSVTPMTVMVILVIYGALSFFEGMLGMWVVFLGSLLFAYPYQKDLAALTDYVEHLALDRRSKAPSFSFLSNVDEVSGGIKKLHESWLDRKHILETTAAESRILLDTLPDTLLMLNSEFRIIRSNKKALEILGKRIIGQTIDKTIKHKALSAALSQALETGESIDIDIQYSPRLVQREFCCKIQRFPVDTRGGIALILMMTDITEAKQTKRMLKDFVANASHEIRTPLTSIIGFIETLQDGAKDEPEVMNQFLGHMSDQAALMNHLVQDLLSLSKAEMNETAALTEQVDIAQLVESASHKIAWQAEQKNMQLKLDITPNLPTVVGDAHELSQVLVNLMTNAVKYGFADTDIQITATLLKDTKVSGDSDLQDRICVSVKDNGEGISEEDIPRLTERFYRVDKARSRKVGGTGLGLCIVKHILNRHHGELTIESKVGDGSKFTIFLPVAEEEKA